MPKVHNKYHKNVPEDAVYVGRPTIFGNPFSHLNGTKAQFQVVTREEAVSKYEEWVRTQPDLMRQIRTTLKGKDLVCWCAPKSCHADVLLRIANGE